MNDTTTDAISIFAPLWKRKWLILAVGILVAAGAYEYYKGKPPVYAASTSLYLGGAAEQQESNGGGKSGLNKGSVANQVALMNSPIIGEVVRKRLRSEHNRNALRGKAKASATATNEFISIATEAHTPKGAVALANGYAKAYIAHERVVYLRHLKDQITIDRRQLVRIELPPKKGKNKGAPSTASTLQAASLANKISQLEESLSTFSGVQQVSPAVATPLPLSPAPKKNAIFGFVVGILLASIGAYALSRLDRRIRSLGEVEEAFKSQIIAALPAVKAPVLRSEAGSVPARRLIEPLRRLHTTLHLAAGRDEVSGSRSILFLSSDAGDGKSSIIANLARVQADGGERVLVIEADFRRPVQSRLLGVTATAGLSDVIMGTVALDSALQIVETAPSGFAEPPSTNGSAPGVFTAAEPPAAGSVSVLLSGDAIANPPALIASDGMAELLRSVAGDFDFVLIDAPSPLEVSDVMPLLPLVDGLVIVGRVGHTLQVSAQRLAQLLGRSESAPLLGVVANCVPRKSIERYGFAWAPAPPRRRRKLVGR